MPFYPSPLKDDGYDIADYKTSTRNSARSTIFAPCCSEAHRLGLKIVTELIINHTSDQHPWFQAARKAPPGSPERDFYVWSDTDQKYLGTRIIFMDTEMSNWTLDPVAKAYYWHRFFSHQPDLNFDNPRVMEAVLETMRFWLDMGVDGFRLDAIPYLVEREGTNNENLRETHDVIKQLRAAIDAQLQEPVPARRGESVARGRARIFRRRRRVPHGLPLPVDAAHLHGHRAGGPLSHRPNHAADAGHPR